MIEIANSTTNMFEFFKLSKERVDELIESFKLELNEGMIKKFCDEDHIDIGLVMSSFLKHAKTEQEQGYAIFKATQKAYEVKRLIELY